MLDRKIKLLSEEWRALVWLMDKTEELKGKRPSLSKAVGIAIKESAITKGYHYEDKYFSKQ